MSPEEVTLLATAISFELAKDRSVEDIFVLRNVAQHVSQSLFLIDSQKQNLDKNCPENKR